MRHGSLFSGIGGFDLAAEWMGWENVFHCENNEFCKKILKYYWPGAKSYNDIKQTDFTEWKGNVDIISGGFPCQPYSQAGKRKGKEDDRHLWPEMLRAIKEIQPVWVVGENVFGIVNWSGGLVFDEVQSDLEAANYEITPFVLPACAKNAPHRRDRVWFVAHSKCKRRNVNEHEVNTNKRNNAQYDIGQGGSVRIITNSTSQRWVQGQQNNETKQRNKNDEKRITPNTYGGIGCKRGLHEAGQEETERYAGSFDSRFIRGDWQNFPTQPPVYNGNDGLLTKLDGITIPRWRNESVKAGGNAVVPQVVYEIFKAIEKSNP